MANIRCLICGAEPDFEKANQPSFPTLDDTEYWITCPRCGKYGIDHYLSGNPPSLGENAPFVSAATRQASERKRPLELKQFMDLGKLAAAHQNSTVSQKVGKLLRAIAERCRRPGNPTGIEPDIDYPLADCEDPDELRSYLAYLSTEVQLIRSYLVLNSSMYEPTIAGWQALEPTLRLGGEVGRCFVAMWFDDSMDVFYNDGIAKAVLDAGFTPYRVKEDPINKGVADHILAEIRRAQFVVADFTGHRQSVYYEAGFAQGIGREVIWCCRENEVSSLTFDTRHLGHVAWKDTGDLRISLSRSIRANITPRGDKGLPL